MDHCYALLERGGLQGGLLIGTFPGCDNAVDIAVNHGQHRPTHCLRVDRRVFGRLAGSFIDAGVAS